ncbi:pentatricopeptide repeat-containing protein At4g01030, mitochondrial-like [Mangifera indica]|uniref:pentatricopeptide repeat-containing protein At4g01030, mitochondrial-like n=1 Tax=Mangifera indica TaxID=29780 RepID=UPI001CFB975E|nr:pentatricopeptide repeat-containing protein At4g01030, mitochondrial-like [Mangifera indica]
MAKLCPIQRLHLFNSDTTLHQNTPPYHQKQVIHSPTFLALAITDASLRTTSLPTSSLQPFPSTPDFRFLNETNEVGSLGSVRLKHAQMIKISKNGNSDTMAKNLILYYLEFGDFESAAKVFFVGYSKNYIEWSSFWKEYESFGGTVQQVLEVFGELHSKGLMYDSRVLTMVLKICTRAIAFWEGVAVHASLIKRGLDFDMHVTCALMNFYGKCWGAESANKVFDEVSIREDLLWNEAVLVNLRNEQWTKAIELFRELQFCFARAYSRTIVMLLLACGKMGALNEGKQIHGYVLKFAMDSNLPISNSLISMYSRNNKLQLARTVFDLMKDRDLSSWNSMISSYAALGSVKNAWDLFNKMNSSNVKPDIITWNCLLSGNFLHGSYTETLAVLHKMQSLGFRPNPSSVSIVLQVVTKLEHLKYGEELHGYVIRNGLEYDVYVATSLIDMYVKNDYLDSARKFFDKMKNRNIFAWNSLISGYSFKGLFDDAKKLLNQMKEEGIQTDLVTWNSLVAGYSIWGQNKEALAAINQMKDSGLDPNVVSWTSLISGSSQNKNYLDSFKYFIQMQQERIKPNSATMSSLLQTCGGLGLLPKGKEIHCFSLKNYYTEDVYIVTALIDMYSKSGHLKSAEVVFRKSANKQLASWNCMIMGFAIYGHGKVAISLFDEMCGADIQPDEITFTALLSACKHSGLVDEGWKYFDRLSTEYGITPTIEHYSCMVDLLGKAGYIDEAWDFIQTMPVKPDATIWGALLGSCRVHGNLKLAKIAAKKLFKLEPYNSANYVLLMNLYAMSNRWEDVERIKDLMNDAGVKIGQVWSWIQIDQLVHVFSAEGKPHPDIAEIYFELYQLVSEMKKLGYEPDLNCVRQNIVEAEKEKVLLSHTEKLAITYGLMKMKGKAPIKVIKNTRVCSDCHTAVKYMSLVRGREILLRDGIRFHHFREGRCSCNDCLQ